MLFLKKAADACQGGEKKAAQYQRSKATCCQKSVGQELSDLLDNGTIRKESLNNRQKECVELYHLSLL